MQLHFCRRFDLTFPEAKVHSLVLHCGRSSIHFTCLFSYPISVNKEVYSNKQFVYVSSELVLVNASILMCLGEWKM